MTTRFFLKVAGWVLLAVILFVTLSPIGLRPHTMTTVNADRALAFAVVAAIFVLAYPRQWKLTALLLIGGALAIEALQYLSPTRHPQLADATVKAAGAAVGTVFGWLWKERRRLFLRGRLDRSLR